MQVNTALLGVDPDVGDSLIFVGLVDNLRDGLGSLVGEAGVQPGHLSAMNRVGGAIFNE